LAVIDRSYEFARQCQRLAEYAPVDQPRVKSDCRSLRAAAVASAKSRLNPKGYRSAWDRSAGHQVAVDLLNYFRAHSISVCTGAFDVPPFVVQEVPTWTLTSYDSTAPKQSSGTLVHNDFVANYSRPLTLADGL
jgi:hypothetical protein